jgi:hypothetical protein
MGNSGFRKYYFPGDYVETKYDNIFDVSVMDLEREEISLSKFKNKPLLIVNTSSTNVNSEKSINELKELQEKYSNLLFILRKSSVSFGLPFQLIPKRTGNLFIP